MSQNLFMINFFQIFLLITIHNKTQIKIHDDMIFSNKNNNYIDKY